MDNAVNLSFLNTTNESAIILSELATFILVVDLFLACFSMLNIMVNFSLLLLSVGFIRGGCQSSSDVNVRRPHYGLHFFIFHCVLSSCCLECIGALTNVGYLATGHNILIVHIESAEMQKAVKKILDFLTYALFNVSHLNFVLLMNVDKLLYVLRPLHYHEMMNRKRVCIISLITWIVACAMASPSLSRLEDTNATIRQEAILFAMCVVCPASFDLLSAVIVSTLVYRIQLRDTHTRLSVKPRPSGSRRRLFSRSGTDCGSGINANEPSLTDELKKSNINRTSSYSITTITACQNFFRHFRVFMRAFTPIIWTCVTTLPYTATMIYLYFGTGSDEEFIAQWTNVTTFRLLRSLGCLYVTYFTGVPLIIIFNNQTYRKRIKSLIRSVLAKLRDFNRRVQKKRYAAVARSAAGAGNDLTQSNMTTTNTTLSTSLKDGHVCNTLSCTEV